MCADKPYTITTNTIHSVRDDGRKVMTTTSVIDFGALHEPVTATMTYTPKPSAD